jgi:hypothetical protein
LNGGEGAVVLQSAARSEGEDGERSGKEGGGTEVDGRVEGGGEEDVCDRVRGSVRREGVESRRKSALPGYCFSDVSGVDKTSRREKRQEATMLVGGEGS